MKFFKVTMLVAIALVFNLTACQNGGKETPTTINQSPKKDIKLFELKNSVQTGITFNNTITENEQVNNLIYDAVHQGGGVAAADFNNDGKVDLFFTGNMTLDRLYINQGNLKFKDITETANVNKGEIGQQAFPLPMSIMMAGWISMFVNSF